MAGICGQNLQRQSFRDIVTNGLVLHFDSFYPDKYVNGTSKLEGLVPSNPMVIYNYFDQAIIPAMPNGILTTVAYYIQDLKSANYVQIDDPTNVFADYPSNGTLCLWVRTAGIAQGQGIGALSKRVHQNPSVGGQWNLGVYGGGTGGSFPQIRSNGTMETGSSFYYNKWIYISSAWSGGNGGTVSIYRNGIFIVSGVSSWQAIQQPGYPVQGFGTSWTMSEFPVVQLYNRTLSSGEMLQNFNAMRQRFKI